MTTTYLPDLSEFARTPTWLGEPLPERIEPDWVTARYDELLDACAAAGDDEAAWIEIVLRTSELESFIDSHGTRAGVAYRQDTTDAGATAEYERWNRTISPVVTDKSIDVARALAASSCRQAIDRRFGPMLMQMVDGACRANAPVNTSLRTELSDVLMKHTKIFGQATITWRGETHPFSYARKAALDPDRAERHAAWQSKVDAIRSHETQLQQIFDDAFALRAQMAANLEQPSYVSLRYLEMRRYDWTPDDARRVRDAIVEHVVPLAAELQSRQARALGTDKLHPADESMQPVPTPEVIVSIDGQLDAASETFRQMGRDFAEPWQLMVDKQLIDLPARPGKGTGGFCTSFSWERLPFIFCNSVGSHDDVKTLVHEFGHALQGWRSRDIEPVELQHPTMEACEIHSMTLELLALPYMRPFFGDGADAFAVEHVRSTLDIVPYLAAIDEFQHRVYDEQLDAAGRGQAWYDAARRFQPAIDWDADEWYGRNRWMFQLHVFQYPFYYLDYGLARIVSWQLWLASLEDPARATQTYLALCDMGGTRSFRQMVLDAGLDDPFDPDVIARTMQQLTPHLRLDLP